MVGVAIRFDLRRSPHGVSYETLYQAALEQSRWAERVGLDAVVLSEHHVAEDGYMTSPLVVASAVAAVTRRIPLSISAITAPLWDPIRLAEDLTTLDLLSRGRASVVLVAGYRQIEFDVLGIDFATRGTRLEEAVWTLRRAWTGEEVEHRGQRVRVLPTPFTAGGPMLMMGGSTPLAARRAARLGMALVPTHHDPALEAAYLEECERLDMAPVFVARPAGPAFLHVSLDPDRDWNRIGPLALHDAQQFHAWQPSGPRAMTHSVATTLAELRAEGVYQILTPEDAVAAIRDLPAGSTLVLHPLMGGLDPDIAAESLELLEHQVLPQVAR